MTAPAIPALPTPPARNQSATVFTTNADAFLGALPAFGAAQNSLGGWMESIAGSVETNAANAASAAASALATSNFIGNWSDQPSGMLNRPASAAHAGVVWILMQDLADVTAAEPGVHAAWASLFATGVARFTVVPVVDDYVGSPRQWVELSVSNKTVWMPPAPPPGTEFGFGTTGVVTGAVLNFNGEKFEGVDIGTIEWDAPPNVGLPFSYINSTVGWRVV